MSLNYDLALINNDLFIDPSTNDLVIAPSDDQHIIDNIAAFPGWNKEYPADGVGLFKYEHSAGQEQALQRAIKIQLQSDGYRVDNPSVTRNDAGELMVRPNAVMI